MQQRVKQEAKNLIKDHIRGCKQISQQKVNVKNCEM